MAFSLSLFSFLAFLYICNAEKSYNGYQVFRAIPETQTDIRYLTEIADAFGDEIDYWKAPEGIHAPVDVMCTPSSVASVRNYLNQRAVDTWVMVDDVQKLIDQQREAPGKVGNGKDLDFTRYNNLTELWAWTDQMASECGSDCAVETYGQSYEGRDLRYIKITRPGSNRRSIYIDATIHAREWIAPAVASYIIERLIRDYGSDANTTALRDAYDWYIIQVVNPDGYDYTWTTDRMWRKTRRPNNGSECVGTDGNRNWDFMWNNGGSSNDTCSSGYMGHSPFSELETRNIGNWLRPIGSGFDLGFSMHSYTQVLLSPWGYTNDEAPDNQQEHLSVGDLFVEAVFNTHGVTYRNSPGGIFSGNTMDYMKGAAGMPFSYLLELRDTGEHGFLLPPEQIIPNSEEVWAGLKAMVQEIYRIQNPTT